MRHISVNKSLLAAAIACAMGFQPVFATNGMAPTGLGQVHKAMGGAAAGYAANTMSMASNPASASFINDGYDVGLELFKPNRTASAGATSFDGNGDELFLIPEGGYKKQLNAKTAAGVVVYGNGGMNTNYTDGVRFGAGYFSGATAAKTGVDLQQLFVSPTVSHKVSENVAIGVSANLVYQKFKAEGLNGFAQPCPNNPCSMNPSNVTNQGYDASTGIGATVGVQGKLSDKLTAGASYRSKVKMSKLDKYKGLFPNQGEMDVPAAATVGIAYQATPKTLVAADVQQIYYSDVAAIGNKTNAGALGATGGAGFGWDDQTVYKVGVKQQLNSNLALMAGYNHGKSPVGAEDTTLNVVAPGVIEDHLSLGFEKKLTPKSKLVGSYVHAFKNSVQGAAYKLQMDQDAIGIGYSREF